MKILHLVAYTKFGGIETYTLDLFSELEGRGHVNVVVAAGLILPNLAKSGRVVHYMPELHSFTDREKGPGERRLGEILNVAAPDVAFVHTALAPGLPSILTSRLRSLYFAHEYSSCCPAGSLHFRLSNRVCDVAHAPNMACYLNAYLQGCNTRRPRGLLASYTRAVDLKGWVSRVDALICASHFVAERHVLAGYDPSRIRVLPFPVRLPSVNSGHAERPPSQRRILYSGRLTAQKGVEVLLRALALLKAPCHLEIAGDGPDRLRLERQVRENRMEAAVRFLGAVDRDAMESVYRTADVVVMPSLWPEPFGFVGLEAGAHGKPVIASNVGGIGEWLVEGENGLGFAPGDHVALASKLDLVLGDPVLARRLGEGGRRIVKDRFTFDRHLDALEAILTPRAVGQEG